MLNPNSLNRVCLSKLLYENETYKNEHDKLIEILEKNDINYNYIEDTKDIWCRDYMPIQVIKDKFVQFRYEPSYLSDDLDLQSDTKEICKLNNIEPIFSDINLDGGNVVTHSNKIIMTDRVFDENPQYKDKSQLIKELESLLEAEIIIIPKINMDFTGHADGMIRFLNDSTVLVNHRDKDYKYISKGINKAMKEHNIDVIDIPFFDYKHKSKKYRDNAIGCYLNYLELRDIIVLPIFEVEGNKDREVIEKFKTIFPNRKIEIINYNNVGLEGGLLNCTTWTV